MAYRLQYCGVSVLHLPDANLRLEPGQMVTVPALTPQMGDVASQGLLTITDLTPPPAPCAGVAPAAAPPPVPPAAPERTGPPRRRHPNAATVLPPRLLARVQRVVIGYVVIPPRLTAAASRRQQVSALHQQGAAPAEIATTMGISRRQVYRLLRAQPLAEPPPASPLPAALLAQVQRFVTGRLYVPAVTAASRRSARLARAFAAGDSTAAIAQREQCSARQVRRARARWRAGQARAEVAPAHEERPW
jgi:DNA-binding CsgD family transcriptional regulator